MAPSSVRVLLAICTVAALAGVSTSSTVSRGKRADDGGPLEAVVEGLSQQVSSFSAHLDTVNAELAALKAKTGWRDFFDKKENNTKKNINNDDDDDDDNDYDNNNGDGDDDDYDNNITTTTTATKTATTTTTAMMIIIIMTAFQMFAVSSPRRYFQHSGSSGRSAIVCKSRATLCALITCNISYVTWFEGRAQLLSLTEFKSNDL